MKTGDLDQCLALAASIPPPPKSKWPWQTSSQKERDAFLRAWTSAILEETVLDGSGHLLSSYFLAQNELNGLSDPFDAPEGLTLGKVFTAAFPVRAPQALPPLDAKALAAFCDDEWGDDGPGMCEGLARTDAFLKA